MMPTSGEIQQMMELLTNEVIRPYQAEILARIRANLLYGHPMPQIHATDELLVPAVSEDHEIDDVQFTVTTYDVPEITMDQMVEVQRRMMQEVERDMWEQVYRNYQNNVGFHHEDLRTTIPQGGYLRDAAYLTPATQWYIPDPGELCPPGCIDLESMSEEEIDAYFDREEQRLADM